MSDYACGTGGDSGRNSICQQNGGSLSLGPLLETCPYLGVYMGVQAFLERFRESDLWCLKFAGLLATCHYWDLRPIKRA